MLLPSNGSRKRRKAQETSDELVLRKPGRPMKRADQLVSSRSIRKASSQRIYERQSASTTMPPASALSSFERLPVEIIQQIFFDALETNLANTSLTLNQVLSQESIYQSLVLFAYFEDDKRNPVETQHFRPAKYRRICVEDRLQLQVGILKCRWCTLQRIMACMPALSRLTMFQQWHQEQRSEQTNYPDLIGTSDRAPSDLIRVPVNSVLHIAALPDIDDDTCMEDHFSARLPSTYYTHFEGTGGSVGPTSPAGFLPFIQCWEHYVSDSGNPNGLVHKTVGYSTATLGVMVVPDKVLQGDPWTEEKVRFLELLRQGLRYKRHSDFILIKASTMMHGIESAIREGNVRVLTLLIELHERIASLYQDGPELDKNYERALTNELDTNPSLDALPASLFHLATKQGSTSSELLSLLIRASWRSIHPDDPTLTRWALRAEAAGDSLGTFLKKYMEGAYGDNFRERPVFIHGAVSWRLREEEYPFPETSFTQEAGYIADHAPNQSMRRWLGPPPHSLTY